MNTVAVGETFKCCREVRLGADRSEVGDKLTGWNTITDTYEEWIVVSVEGDFEEWLAKRVI